MVDVLWLEQRSVPIFESEGHCLFIQGKGVSREAGNTTTNIQNLNYPCRTDIPHLSCHISQLESTTLFTCIYDQNQHIDPDTKYRSHKFTPTNTYTYTYMYVCVYKCVCTLCSMNIGNDKKLMSLHDNKLYTYSFTIRQIFSNRLGGIFIV